MAITIPTTRDYGRNAGRVTGDASPCVVCGRGIQQGKQRYMVHVVNGGGMLARNGEVEDGAPGEMGWHPIGPDCLANHPELAPYVTDTGKD